MYRHQIVDSIRVKNTLRVDTIASDTKHNGINIEGINLSNGTIGLPLENNDNDEIQFHAPVSTAYEFTFLAPVHFQNEVHGINIIKPIDCQACKEEQTPGFAWDNKTICLNCIRDVSIQFRAKESWAEKNGDPISNLLEHVKELEKKIVKLESQPRVVHADVVNM